MFMPYIESTCRAIDLAQTALPGYQFGLISDQITNINITASRGSSEAMRLRQLREGVAQVKQALEIAITQTKQKHSQND